MRRARNEISRSRELSLAAAELLDQGATDAAVAAALSRTAGRKIAARTVAAFRMRDYAPIAAERLTRRDAARRVEMILSGAAGSFAQAGQELLARMMYDLLENARDMSPKELIGAGKTLSKIREVELAADKAAIERSRYEAGRAAEAVAGNAAMTPAERQMKIREIFGFVGCGARKGT